MTQMMICPNSKECEKKHLRDTFQNTVHDRCNPHQEITKISNNVTCSMFCPANTDRGFICPPCIPYEHSFSVGDRVRVLGRTLCGDHRWFKPLADLSININDICKIQECSPKACSCGSNTHLIQDYYFHEQDLELIEPIQEGTTVKPKHKVGDTVRITTEYDSSYMVHNMKEYLGKELKIDRFKPCGSGREPRVILGGNTWSWRAKDLEIVDIPTVKPKYKILKPLTLAELIENSAIDNDETWRLAKWMDDQDSGPRVPLTAINGFLDYAKQYKCFWEFLTEGGYIEEVESKYDRWVKECPAYKPDGKMEKVVEWAKRMPRTQS